MEYLTLDIHTSKWIEKYGGNAKIRQHESKYGLILARNKDFIVLKSPAGMHWAARGEQKYMPAMYTVYRIIRVEKIYDAVAESLAVEYVIQFTVPRKSSSKEAKDQLSWIGEGL